MDIFDKLFKSIIKYEGYYANVTGDKGGETYMGISRKFFPDWEGWEIVDSHKSANGGKIAWNEEINNNELTSLVSGFYKEKFYLKNKIDLINSAPVQEIILDWCVNSGTKGKRGTQNTINAYFGKNLVADGIFGQMTINAINSCDPERLFDAIKAERIDYYEMIAKNGSNAKFLKGWLKRVNSIKYSA